MQVADVKGQDVICIVKNSSTLAGSLFTMHVSQVHIDLPTLSDVDKHVSTPLYISRSCQYCFSDSVIC